MQTTLKTRINSFFRRKSSSQNITQPTTTTTKQQHSHDNELSSENLSYTEFAKIVGIQIIPETNEDLLSYACSQYSASEDPGLNLTCSSSSSSSQFPKLDLSIFIPPPITRSMGKPGRSASYSETMFNEHGLFMVSRTKEESNQEEISNFTYPRRRFSGPSTTNNTATTLAKGRFLVTSAPVSPMRSHGVSRFVLCREGGDKTDMQRVHSIDSAIDI